MNNQDFFSTDFEVQLSQIVMKIFWTGYLAGQKQLEDDFDSGDKPLNMAIQELQEKLGVLTNKGKDLTQMLNLNTMLEKKERQYNNITPNQKKLNALHDVIVDDLMTKLEQEVKTVRSNIVSNTKHAVIKKRKKEI